MSFHRHAYLILFSLATLIVALVMDEPFFWDTIQLGAMHGDWFYQQNFSTLLLPDRIDSGHIPAFGWYLALIWKLFGQNLWVSHLAMLPWVFLVFVGLYQLVSRFTNKAQTKLGIVLGLSIFIVDPVLISQLTLISPDVILVGAFLLAVNSILEKNKRLLVLAIILLGFISMRGVMVAFCLYLWQVSNHSFRLRHHAWSTLSKLVLPYLPGALLVAFYIAYHYIAKGWIGVHSDSPWAESFATVGLSAMLKQVIILGWRMLDFGRIFIWLSLGVLLWKLYKTRIKDRLSLGISTETISFVRLAFILIVVLGLPAIISSGLSQHRYFLPIFIVLSLVFWQLLTLITDRVWRNTLWIIVIIGLASGNKWIYPPKIAQGWDASLVHKSYFGGKKNVKKFLSEENILPSEVGSVFPEVGPFHHRELNNKMDGFAKLDMNKQDYVFYSTVMNDFTDEQLDDLNQHWDIIFKEKHKGVSTIVYRKRRTGQ